MFFLNYIWLLFYEVGELYKKLILVILVLLK